MSMGRATSRNVATRRSKATNCIIKTWLEEIGDAYWTGIGWLSDREKAMKLSLPEVENHVENMRNDDVMVFWERYDKDRSSL